MKRTTKKLCGWIGLAIVLAVTILASKLPLPVAAGAEHTDTLVVHVHEPGSLVIEQPRDGYTATNTELPVTVSFSDAYTIEYTLIYTDPTTGDAVRLPIATFTPSLDATAADSIVCVEGDLCTGSYNFSFDINALTSDNGYGNYLLEAKSSDGGQEVNTDSTAFVFAPVYFEVIGTEANGDPIIHLVTDEGVTEVTLTITDSAGHPLGDPLVVPVPASATADGFDVTLPFEQSGATAGTYQITATAATATEAAGSQPITPSVTAAYQYAPPQIAVPNTGGLSFANLRLSQVDYLVTGGLIFLSIAAFALFLILRRRRD